MDADGWPLAGVLRALTLTLPHTVCGPYILSVIIVEAGEVGSGVGPLAGLTRVGFLGKTLVKPLGRPAEVISFVMFLRRLPRPISPKNLPV